MNYLTVQCEDATTVNCIETIGHHSHHHHHHKRSAEREADTVELKPEVLEQMIKKKPPSDFPKKEKRISGIFAAAGLGTLDRLFKITLIYCKQFDSCSSSLLPNVSKSEMEFLNRERNLANFERNYPHMNIYELLKKLDDRVDYKDMLRYIFAQYFNINEDAFLAFIFDDKLFIEKESHQQHKRSVEEEIHLGDSKHLISAVDKTADEKRGKNFQTEGRRKSSVSFFAMLSDVTLTYCKHYESCNSSIHANVSRSEREIINRERSVATFKRNNPNTDIFDLKKYLDDNKPLKDLFREGFAEVFNISEDAFLSFFFDDKPFIRNDSPKQVKLLSALFKVKST